jgi:xylulokinase
LNNNNKHIAFAAVDIGTSQIKLGVFCPSVSPCIEILGRENNDIRYGAKGEVTSSIQSTTDTCFSLFKKLGKYLQDHPHNQLYLGICSHVSSLLEWDRHSGEPIKNDFPIWMDSTCEPALQHFTKLMGGGRSRCMLGSFLPAGTHWLLTKLLAHRERMKGLFLQAGDAIFYRLSGKYATHFSCQVSLVHHRGKKYVDELLSAAGINTSQLPAITSGWISVLPGTIRILGWPRESFVFPSMADFYASFYSLGLKDSEGFILGNTSEITGVYSTKARPAPEQFVGFPFKNGHIRYNSTSTGANLVEWFISNVLGREWSANLLDTLSEQAAMINPEDTPLFLPYISGERAPFWNHRLKASFNGLQQHHTSSHMFRAVLEGVAFARRQCFEFLGDEGLKWIKMGGGTAKNKLWNKIRASVMNRTFAISAEKELAISGLIHYISSQVNLQPPETGFDPVEPDQQARLVYEKKYGEFINIQKALFK